MAWSKAMVATHNGTASDYVANVVDPIYNLLEANSSLDIQKEVVDSLHTWYYFNFAATSPFGESFFIQWAEEFDSGATRRTTYYWDGVSADSTTVGGQIGNDSNFQAMYQAHTLEVYTSDSDNGLIALDNEYQCLFGFWPGDTGWMNDFENDPDRVSYTPILFGDRQAAPQWGRENTSVGNIETGVAANFNDNHATRPVYTDAVTYRYSGAGLQKVNRETDSLMRLNPNNSNLASNGQAKMFFYDSKYYIGLGFSDNVIYELGASVPTGGFLTGSMS